VTTVPRFHAVSYSGFVGPGVAANGSSAFARNAMPMGGQDDIKCFFTAGVEENMNALYGVALRLTRNGADAEDLVAECVAKAWAAIDTLSDRKLFRPWMFRILRNCFISDRRRRSVRPVNMGFEAVFEDEGEHDLATFLLEQPDSFLAWWSNPERNVSNEILGQRIMSAIDALPECFKATILLITVEGLGYDEAAEAPGVPTGTVRSRMKRGRTLLQKALWEFGHEAGLIHDNGPDGTST
jgi:RNA polymerase sigma-70 factor, ECF subfamily